MVHVVPAWGYASDYVTNDAVRDENLLTCNFTRMIEVLSVEDVVTDVESTAFLKQFLKKFYFQRYRGWEGVHLFE